MSSIAALVQGQIQEVKARSLQTLMAVLDEMGGAGLADPKYAAARQNGQSPQHATVLLPPQGNKLTIALGGMPLEVILPDALASAAKSNPAMLARGTVLMVEPDLATGTLRVILPQVPTVPTPATTRTFSTITSGPSTSAPPPLADFFPAGSPGAVIQRLTGLNLPLAERADAQILGTTPRHTGPLPPSLPAPLMDAALRATIRQVPLGQTLSALLAQVETLDPKLADALRNLRLDGLFRPDPAQIASSIKNSGLFLEARLANLQPGAAPPTGDLKALLNGAKATLPDLSARLGERVSATPPPAELARMVEGAVERIKLQQMASLPDHPGLNITDDRSQPMRLALQIPLAIHGQERPETAMVGLMIEHQPHPDRPADVIVDEEGDNKVEGFPWKVRIAVDLEETGPVQAEIALRGQRIAVTLWAERKSMAEDARAAIGALHQALTGAAFEVSNLEVRDGRPAGPSPRYQPTLDRRS
ncbi:MAG: flagellar hook-length control protein FliK [Rhizobiales bacterium]|nr:flagellar hook-length control protein FliK [Hyphomicrobiales bacterium]